MPVDSPGFTNDQVAAVGGQVFVGVPDDQSKADPDGGKIDVFDNATGTLVDRIYSSSPDPLTYDRFGDGILPWPTGFVVAATSAGPGSARGPGVVYIYDLCGNGTRAAGEQCDDGNVAGGDGCSPTCKLELCDPTPRTGCRKAPATKSRPAFADKQRDVQDSLTWKWTRGAATTAPELGNPLATTAYALCVYDGSAAPQPLLDLAALPGASWQAAGPGVFSYKNSALAPSGIPSLKLKAGPAGSTSITFKAKGARMGRLAHPPTALVTRVTVQLTNSDTGVCWEATYAGTVLHLTSDKFVALSDP